MITELLLAKAEQELLVVVAAVDNTKADEAGQKGDDLGTRKARETDEMVEREGVAAEGVEELADGISVGHHGATGVLRVTPYRKVDGRGHDVLVGNADVGTRTVIVVEGADGTSLGRRDGGDDNCPKSSGADDCIRRNDVVCVELNASLGTAVAVGGLVHHVDFLLGAYARHVAVVAHANQQPPTVGISKGRHRASQFAGIRDAVLEVLLLVLALADEPLEILLVVHRFCRLFFVCGLLVGV